MEKTRVHFELKSKPLSIIYFPSATLLTHLRQFEVCFRRFFEPSYRNHYVRFYPELKM
jgi:hypothetical protein